MAELILGVITSLMPFAIKMLAKYVDHLDERAKSKELFYEFIKALHDESKSVKARDSYYKHLKRLEKMEKADE